MSKVLALSLFSLVLAYGADEKAKSPSFADEAFNKALDGNASDAVKAYSDYLSKLDVANKKVLAALEVVKKDLNDTAKNKGMSIQDRAKAIAEIDEKIAGIKKDGVGEAVVGRVVAKVDLLGDVKADLASKVLGKWKYYFSPPRFNNLEFAAKGVIRNGNNSEASWRLTNGKLEILTSTGAVGRRFAWNEDEKKWAVSDVVDVQFANQNAYIMRE